MSYYEVGDGGGRKLRKSSTGYHLKQLFIGHPGALRGIVWAEPSA